MSTEFRQRPAPVSQHCEAIHRPGLRLQRMTRHKERLRRLGGLPLVSCCSYPAELRRPTPRLVPNPGLVNLDVGIRDGYCTGGPNGARSMISMRVPQGSVM